MGPQRRLFWTNRLIHYSVVIHTVFGLNPKRGQKIFDTPIVIAIINRMLLTKAITTNTLDLY